MKSLRVRAHNLIDLLPQSDLEQVWAAIETQYYDLYVLRALQDAKEHFLPGDVLTRDEAMLYLSEEIITTTEPPLS
jgi:hypothetical protein